MNNFLVLLRSGNIILKVLGQFRTSEKAKWFIEDEYPEFTKDVNQWSKYKSPEFITIEKITIEKNYDNTTKTDGIY